jgi:hypothetical protein
MAELNLVVPPLGPTGPYVHTCCIVREQERLFRGVGTVDEIQPACEQIVLDCFHPLSYQWATILNGLSAHLPEARVLSGIIIIRGPAIQYTDEEDIGLLFFRHNSVSSK